MRLHYYKDPRGNFGDDLNAWLWPRILPGVHDDDERELFVGIGTLINHRLPATPLKHIVGSGVGYGRTPVPDASWVVHAVRGPLSAAALGLEAGRAITDAAVLIRLLGLHLPARRSRCGLVVTGDSLARYDWQAVCELAGIRFISCHWDVDRVLQAMGECELLLCEAMHGAIVADALRIPWLPVSLYGRLLEFKWQDWLASLQMSYRPEHLTALHAAPAEDPLSRVKQACKRSLHRIGLYASAWSPPRARPTGARELEQTLSQLHKLASSSGMLSPERLLDEHVERYLALFGRAFAHRSASIQDAGGVASTALLRGRSSAAMAS
ncbi:polysaccharide pyruvyl transferase [Pseudothauera lacus]|uniref:Polysaccharide pyruvyl transferase n=1 Tax=Pseudothauera lacus TaxID=2136175 RepID=A0A2T4IG87_9RHOO|nr:polysaccharide pyruvyl transferase [Pseudothauera lacus]PTD96771.1 polysaccharide pyruvyl transferase [Pseudothauera lacus]